MTFDEFKALNPGRTGEDNGSLCFICGDRVQSGLVYCKTHVGTISNTRRPSAGWVQEVLCHPDFNGKGFRGMYPKRPTAEAIYESLRRAE